MDLGFVDIGVTCRCLLVTIWKVLSGSCSCSMLGKPFESPVDLLTAVSFSEPFKKSVTILLKH